MVALPRADVKQNLRINIVRPASIAGRDAQFSKTVLSQVAADRNRTGAQRVVGVAVAVVLPFVVLALGVAAQVAQVDEAGQRIAERQAIAPRSIED